MARMIDTNTVLNKDTSVEFIRDILRDGVASNRKQKRDANLNTIRLVLGESIINKEYSEDLVSIAAKNLRKKSLNIQDYRKLQNALLQSENHISAFLKVDNAIQGLIRDFFSTSAHSKLGAANCCCNLALGNSKTCIVLSKFVGPYLIAELESTNQPLAEVCAWTIGNLTSECKKSFDILNAQGCIKSIINAAEKSSNNVLSALSYAYLRCIRIGINSIENSDLIKFGEIISMKYPEVSDIDSMWLLAILSSKEECKEFLMKCICEMCIYLYKAISNKDENIVKISAALRIICNTISEPTGQVVNYLFCDEMDKNCSFLNKLLSHKYIHIRQEALWLLGNLYNHHLNTVQQLVKTMLPLLPSLNLGINSFKEII